MLDHPERIAWSVTVAAFAAYGLIRGCAWWFRHRPDTAIDGLIARNRAQAIPGYEKTDESVLDRVGQRCWESTLRAQRRLRKPSDGNLRKFDRSA